MLTNMSVQLRALVRSFVYCCFMQLQQDIQMKQNEVQREMRKKDKMERELNNEKKEVDAKTSEIKSLQSQLQRCKDDNIRMEQQLKEQRVSNNINICITASTSIFKNLYIFNPDTLILLIYKAMVPNSGSANPLGVLEMVSGGP